MRFGPHIASLELLQSYIWQFHQSTHHTVDVDKFRLSMFSASQLIDMSEVDHIEPPNSQILSYYQVSKWRKMQLLIELSKLKVKHSLLELRLMCVIISGDQCFACQKKTQS